MDASVLEMRKWLHSHVQLPPGGKLLDVGCGGGEDLRLMAEAMQGSFSFVGVDSRLEVIESARQSTADSRVTYEQASADERLPFEGGSFDVVYSVNTLECLSDREGFLWEVRRLLKPEGRLVIAHWDWDTQTFDGKNRDLVRKIVHAFNDWKQAWMTEIDPWMGRRLWKTMQGSGLFLGEVEAYTLRDTDFSPGHYGWNQAQNFRALVKRGLISPDEYEIFLRWQEELAANGEFFFSMTMYAYVGHSRRSDATAYEDGTPPSL